MQKRSLIERAQGAADTRKKNQEAGKAGRIVGMPVQHYHGDMTVNPTGESYVFWSYVAATACKVSDIKFHIARVTGESIVYAGAGEARTTIGDTTTTVPGEIVLEANERVDFHVHNVGKEGVVYAGLAITFMVSPA